MTVAYATSAELETWTGESAPANAAWLLARASELVDSIVTAPFAIDDETKLPTDAIMVAVLRDATCAQVKFWDEVGYEHDIDGLAGTNVSIGGLSSIRPPKHAPQALRILDEANLR